jgi:uncharacterized protein (UPF0335 family)
MYTAPEKEIDQSETNESGEIVQIDGVAGKRLKSFIERIERLIGEKDALAQDISEIYTEAKSVGFDTKTMRKIIKLRKMDADKRAEEQMMLETYANAVQLSLI